jgi:CRP-like cAMP-binding protein
MREEHLETLAAVPLFAGLSKRELLSILNTARVVEFGHGSPLVKEGEKGKGFFVITKGRAKVTVSGVEVATLNEGSHFGEMAALDGGPRAATITAETPVTTLELTPTALLRIVNKEPAVAAAIFQELRGHLEAAGGTLPGASDTPITSAELIELSGRLRGVEHAEWAEPRSLKHRRLGLSKLYARGQ